MRFFLVPEKIMQAVLINLIRRPMVEVEDLVNALKECRPLNPQLVKNPTPMAGPEIVVEVAENAKGM
jgi:hypothetical protein